MFDEHWRLVDPFTVDQAVALWCECEPSPWAIGNAALARKGELTPQRVAIRQMLYGAVSEGKIATSNNNEFSHAVGNYGESFVTRDELIKFARSKGQFPAFLFDTIAPEARQEDVPTPATPKNKGGRPEEFDWNLMFAEIVRFADLNELPKKQSELIDHLLLWFANGMSEKNASGREYPAPSESNVKSRVSTLYNNLKKLNWKPD